MADDGGDRAITERRHQADDVPDQVERAVGGQIVVEGDIRAGGAPVPSQVRRNHVKASGRQRL